MLKNKILLLVVLALVCYGLVNLVSCIKIEVKNADSKGKNIICFGDSVTFGYGANPGEDYPSTLAKMVKPQVINAGIDGDTTDEALRRLDSDVLNRDPLLVILEFGGNDFLRKIPIETSIKNVRVMVDKIQAGGAMVAIADVSAGMFLKDYRLAYGALAREKGCIFIPNILSGIITNPSMKSDFLHPNANGYRNIAEYIFHTIKPYLSQEAISKKASG